MVLDHPLSENRSAAAYDAGNTLRRQGDILDQHAGMDRHVIDALLSLFFNHLEHHAGSQIFHAAHASQSFINRNGTDRNRRCRDDGFANSGNVSAGREIHHRIGSILHRILKFLQFLIDIRSGCRVADVRVDLARRCHADAHGLQRSMVDVGRDNHASPRNFVPNCRRRKLLPPGNVVHFAGDLTLAGVVHLCADRILLPRFYPFTPHRGYLTRLSHMGIKPSDKLNSTP